MCLCILQSWKLIKVLGLHVRLENFCSVQIVKDSDWCGKNTRFWAICSEEFRSFPSGSLWYKNSLARSASVQTMAIKTSGMFWKAHDEKAIIYFSILISLKCWNKPSLFLTVGWGSPLSAGSRWNLELEVTAGGASRSLCLLWFSWNANPNLSGRGCVWVVPMLKSSEVSHSLHGLKQTFS